MGRRVAREVALKIIFSFDLSPKQEDINKFIENYWDHISEEEKSKLSEEDICFANELAQGTLLHIDLLDKVIKHHIKDTWNWDRVATVDKNILRLSLYEIFFLEDIPTPVTLNEAVELAKKYGDEKAYRFINGLLNSIKEELDKSWRTWIELA